MESLVAGARSLGLELTQQQTERYRRYLAVLRAWNSRISLTSPAALADAERVHFLDSLTLMPALRATVAKGGRLLDVGSGAGFPGLALKVALPGLDVVLLEATGKKAAFLRAVRTELGLEGVEVIAARAEDAARDAALRERFDAVTARALGRLAAVLELALPFCRTGGVLLAPRGADAEREAVRCAGAMETLGGRLRGVEPVRVEGLPERRAIVIVEKTAGTPERFPRRAGVPGKCPLA